MKNIIFVLVFILVLCSFTFAQSNFSEINRVREIKLLESTREDVRRILWDFKSDDSIAEEFSTKNFDISISYSTGNCSNDEEESWEIPAGRAKFIEISPEDSIRSKLKLNQLGYDISKFRKEKIYINSDDEYMYHDKDSGIAVEVNEKIIEKIYLVPQKKDLSLLCDKEDARKYLTSDSWFLNKLEERYLTVDENYPANLDQLTLSSNEIVAECSLKDSIQNKTLADASKKIAVFAKGNDPENDTIIYVYKVSAGKIIGKGSNVVWDLSGVKPGKYTITAGVDDGCGICGEIKTEEIIIVENPNCPLK